MIFLRVRDACLLSCIVLRWCVSMWVSLLLHLRRGVNAHLTKWPPNFCARNHEPGVAARFTFAHHYSRTLSLLHSPAAASLVAAAAASAVAPVGPALRVPPVAETSPLDPDVPPAHTPTPTHSACAAPLVPPATVCLRSTGADVVATPAAGTLGLPAPGTVRVVSSPSVSSQHALDVTTPRAGSGWLELPDPAQTGPLLRAGASPSPCCHGPSELSTDAAGDDAGGIGVNSASLVCHRAVVNTASPSYAYRSPLCVTPLTVPLHEAAIAPPTVLVLPGAATPSVANTPAAAKVATLTTSPLSTNCETVFAKLAERAQAHDAPLPCINEACTEKAKALQQRCRLTADALAVTKLTVTITAAPATAVVNTLPDDDKVALMKSRMERVVEEMAALKKGMVCLALLPFC